MDKIKFAQLINLLTIWGMRELEYSEVLTLENLITPTPSQLPAQQLHIAPQMVHDLIEAMVDPANKIPAIKVWRALTGEELKEAKEAVEKYWPMSIK